LNRLAPQAKGLLQKKSLTLAETNKLRQILDNKVLGSSSFLKDKLPFEREIVEAYSNALRSRVKSKGPKGIEDVFKEYSKEITLKKALLEREVAGMGKSAVTTADLWTALGGAGVGSVGGPVGTVLGGIGAAGAKRVIQSPGFNIGAARTIQNAEKAISTLSPAVKAFFLRALNKRATSSEE